MVCVPTQERGNEIKEHGNEIKEHGNEISWERDYDDKHEGPYYFDVGAIPCGCPFCLPFLLLQGLCLR